MSDGYECVAANSLDGFSYAAQTFYSVCLKKTKRGMKGEGNCSLSSVFALLNYCKTSGECPSFPDENELIEYDVTADPVFIKYKDKKRAVGQKKRLPALYIAVRNTATQKCGYKLGSTNPFMIPRIIRLTAKKYGVAFKTRHRVIYSFERAKKEIDSGRPLIWNTALSSTYRSHTTVVTGYREYTKIKRFLCFKYVSRVTLLQLNDNWTKAPRFFDLTNYHLIGSMITVKKKAD